MDNNTLTDIPRAQEAYNRAAKALEDVDATELLTNLKDLILQKSEAGGLATTVGGISDLKVAEKAYIRLSELGYRVNVQFDKTVQKEDGTLIPTYYIYVGWLQMPDNCRDAYTV